MSVVDDSPRIARAARKREQPRPRHKRSLLDPAVIRLIDALAKAQAKEDHEREGNQ